MKWPVLKVLKLVKNQMIKQEIRIFLTAVMFYTRIPCPSNVDHSEEYLNKATRYFPLVGIIVGTASFIVFWVFNQFLNIQISIIFSIITGILITGAFHEDGLADTFDGFGGGWTKQKILEIMKDSTLGSYGVISLILCILIKIFALSELFSILIFEANSYFLILFVFIIYHSIARFTAINLVFTSRYSREDLTSKSKPIAQKFTIIEILGSYIFGLAPLVGIIYFKTEFVFILLPLAILFLLSLRYFNKHLGGYTGDCLGALEQLSECLCILSFLVIANLI